IAERVLLLRATTPKSSSCSLRNRARRISSTPPDKFIPGWIARKVTPDIIGFRNQSELKVRDPALIRALAGLGGFIGDVEFRRPSYRCYRPTSTALAATGRCR